MWRRKYKEKEEVMDEMEKRFRIRFEIERIRFRKNKQIIIECTSEREKNNILERRKIMKGTGIWIREEKTKRELEVEIWIRRKAKWVQSNGELTVMEGKKVKIRGEWWCWNERRGELEL